MGQVIAMANCPWHADRNPSLAIYENGYYCFGCHKKGILLPWMTEIVHGIDYRVTKNLPRVDEEKYSFSYNDKVLEFLSKRGISEERAKSHGIKARHSTILIPCYDISQTFTGYQQRNVTGKSKNKYITIPHNGEYPEYCYCAESELGQFDYLVLVESMVDALHVNTVGNRALALLGTTMRGDLHLLLSSLDIICLILFDPDATVIGSYLCDKLNAHGILTTNIVTEKKPYEYSLEELASKLAEMYHLRR